MERLCSSGTSEYKIALLGIVSFVEMLFSLQRFINPQSACAVRVTVYLSVLSMSTLSLQATRQLQHLQCHKKKKMVIFLKLLMACSIKRGYPNGWICEEPPSQNNYIMCTVGPSQLIPCLYLCKLYTPMTSVLLFLCCTLTPYDFSSFSLLSQRAMPKNVSFLLPVSS